MDHPSHAIAKFLNEGALRIIMRPEKSEARLVLLETKQVRHIEGPLKPAVGQKCQRKKAHQNHSPTTVRVLQRIEPLN